MGGSGKRQLVDGSHLLLDTIGKLRRGFPIAMHRDWGPRLRLPLPPDIHKINVGRVVGWVLDPRVTEPVFRRIAWVKDPPCGLSKSPGVAKPGGGVSAVVIDAATHHE